MSIHGQDILVLLKLSVNTDTLSYEALAAKLYISASQVHSAIRRMTESGLINTGSKSLNYYTLTEFLVHGCKYVFPPKLGAIVRGMPTAQSAAPLNSKIMEDNEPLVWPDPEGEVRGTALTPIHRAVPMAAKLDNRLYERLALLDAVRGNRVRERNLAADMLKLMLHSDPEDTGTIPDRWI